VYEANKETLARAMQDTVGDLDELKSRMQWITRTTAVSVFMLVGNFIFLFVSQAVR
jgi:hypothetical protein